MHTWLSRSALILALGLCWNKAAATIVVNPAMPIDRELVVQLIQSRENDGSPAATVFGDPAQRLSIETAIDQIWAQAGINVTILPTVTTYNSSFAFNRNGNTTGTRPIDDFDTIFVQASSAGVLNTDNVINAIFVDYVPGFPILSENTSAGLASLPGNEITVYVGDNLLGFQNGLDVIAKVFAHEIGHNLGLDHLSSGSDNLMAVSMAASERLNASQINSVRTSSLLRVIPEPSTALMAAGFGLALLLVRRR